MRFAGLALTILLLAPLAAADLSLTSPCTAALGAVADTTCAPIRPGARMTAPSGCTLNFVVTDGIDLFIGTAGHCVGATSRVHVQGVGDIGRVALDGARGDWAFVRIDPAHHALVDPTLSRWGGPTSIRAPLLAGEPVLHYGHGASLGQVDATRGRAGEVLVAGSESRQFLYAGSVDRGDSGSPVLLATGEAAGIAVATIFAGPAPVPATFATRFDLAVEELADTLGRPVTLVPGRPLAAP